MMVLFRKTEKIKNSAKLSKVYQQNKYFWIEIFFSKVLDNKKIPERTNFSLT